MTPNILPDLSKILGEMKFPRHKPLIVLRRPPFTPTNLRAMETLSRRTKLPYFNMTAALQVEMQAGSMVGMAVKHCLAGHTDPPTELVVCVAAFQLGSARFAQGGILDELPVTLQEAGLLAQFLRVKAMVELDAPDEHLVKRAQERRQCVICRRTYLWQRKPADRVYRCECGGLVPPLQPRTPPEETVAEYRQDTTALADFYQPQQVTHVVVNADNDVPEDELLTAVEAAITALPPETAEEGEPEPPGSAASDASSN